MTLIYVHEATIPGENARAIQVVNTCVSLASAGTDVNLVVEECDSQNASELASFYGLEWPKNMFITTSPKRSITHAVRTAIRTNSSSSTILFCRNLRTARMLLPLSKRTGTPLVYEAHKIAFMVVSDEARLAGLSARQVPRKVLRTFRAESDVLRRARGVVCTSEAVAALARTLFGRERDVIVARNGGPEPVRLAADGEPGSAPEENGHGRLRIVYVGGLGGWKGTDTLFRAMRLLEELQLVVVGRGVAAEDAGASDPLRTHPLPEGSLSVTGYLPPGDVMPFLTSQKFAAAAITLPAQHSAEPLFFTCPLKLFQYLAAGIPVVASDVPALREILRHRENAYLVKPDDPEALAEGIKTVAFDSKLALTLTSNGYETAGRHTWRRRAGKLASFLKGIA